MVDINFQGLDFKYVMSLMADIADINILVGDIKVNTYRGTHTYGGPGSFELKVEDPNRNEGVLNMVGSVDTPFAI